VGLFGQLWQVVPVEHRPARASARAGGLLAVADEADVLDTDVRRGLEPAPVRGQGVLAAVDPHERLAAHADHLDPPGLKGMVRQRAPTLGLLGEPLHDGAAVLASRVRRDRLDFGQHACGNRLQALTPGDRGQVCQSDAAPPGLDAALVVTLPGPREARLKQVVADQGTETIRELPVQTHAPLHCRCEVVIEHPCRHTPKIGEGPDVTIEERELVAPLVQPHEVPPRVHQANNELPHLEADSGHLHGYREEVDLGLLAWPMDQGDVHLGLLPPLLRQHPPYRGNPHVEPFLHELPVHPRAGEPLLRRHPPLPLLEQPLDPLHSPRPHRTPPWLQLTPPRL